MQNPKIDHLVNVNINNQMVLLGCDFKREDRGGKPVAHFICYWRRIGKVPEQLGFFLQFSNVGNKAVFSNLHVFGYRVYQPQSFPEGGIIKEHLYIFHPDFVKEAKFKVAAGLYDLLDGRILPVLKTDTVDNKVLFSLGEISFAP